MDNPTPDKVWNEFWKPLFEADEHHRPQEAQVKNELFDYWQVMERVPKVYCHITGHQLSKLLYDADVVCNAADEHYQKINNSLDVEFAALITSKGGIEADHSAADNIICDLLLQLGFTKTEEAFEKLPKVYA